MPQHLQGSQALPAIKNKKNSQHGVIFCCQDIQKAELKGSFQSRGQRSYNLLTTNWSYILLTAICISIEAGRTVFHGRLTTLLLGHRG
jgi:hypothetical protein